MIGNIQPHLDNVAYGDALMAYRGPKNGLLVFRDSNVQIWLSFLEIEREAKFAQNREIEVLQIDMGRDPVDKS
jgi:hypothetical protein